MRKALHIISFYAVFLVQSISAELLAEVKETNRTIEHFSKDLGPLHIHVSTRELPPEQETARWDDKHATLKATILVNIIKELPELNPFHGKAFGPYDVSLRDLHFDKSNLTFENIIVTGIKDMSLVSQTVNIQLSPARIDFNASVPNVTVEADFVMDTIFDNLPICDTSHFKATLLNLVVSAAFGPKSVKFKSGNAYQLESAVVTINLGNVQLEMDTKYAKEVKLILDEFFQYSEDLIVDNDVVNMILKAINQELAKIPENKIDSYLLGNAKPDLTQFGPDSMKRSGRKYG